LPGVKVRFGGTPHFKEFVVDFGGTGRTPGDINRALLKEGIYGGSDLTGKVSGMEGCALYCVTEMHVREEIDGLVEALGRVIGK
jgi:glycine dehydrogenase subunit 1